MQDIYFLPCMKAKISCLLVLAFISLGLLSWSQDGFSPPSIIFSQHYQGRKQKGWFEWTLLMYLLFQSVICRKGPALSYTTACAYALSCVQLFVTLQTVTCQDPLSMGLSRWEWNRLPFPSPRDLPDPGIKPVSLVSPVLASEFFTTAPPGKPYHCTLTFI